MCISSPCCEWKADSVLRRLMGQPGASGLQKTSKVSRGISSLTDPLLAGGLRSKPAPANQGARGRTSTCSTTPTQQRANHGTGSQSTALAASSLSEGFFKPLTVRKPQKVKPVLPHGGGSYVNPACWVPGRLSSPWLQPWETLRARRLQDAVQFACHISQTALGTPAWGGIRYRPPSHRANLQPCFAEQLRVQAVLGDGWWQMVCV